MAHEMAHVVARHHDSAGVLERTSQIPLVQEIREMGPLGKAGVPRDFSADR
jgi:hypothetical protein